MEGNDGQNRHKLIDLCPQDRELTKQKTDEYFIMK